MVVVDAQCACLLRHFKEQPNVAFGMNILTVSKHMFPQFIAC